MKREKLEVVKGSGNVFRDLGHKNADADDFWFDSAYASTHIRFDRYMSVHEQSPPDEKRATLTAATHREKQYPIFTKRE